MNAKLFCMACLVIGVTSIHDHCGTFSSEPVRNNVVPPCGTKMPPDEIRIVLKSDRNKDHINIRGDLFEYTAGVRMEGEKKLASIGIRAGCSIPSTSPPATWSMGGGWGDDDISPVSGQIYRWKFRTADSDVVGVSQRKLFGVRGQHFERAPKGWPAWSVIGEAAINGSVV